VKKLTVVIAVECYCYHLSTNSI